jgi:hypothetical protein
VRLSGTQPATFRLVEQSHTRFKYVLYEEEFLRTTKEFGLTSFETEAPLTDMNHKGMFPTNLLLALPPTASKFNRNLSTVP